MSEWVSVSERLPAEICDTLIYESVRCLVTDGQYVGVSAFDRGHGCGKPWRAWSEYGDLKSGQITHWMKLPETPK